MTDGRTSKAAGLLRVTRSLRDSLFGSTQSKYEARHDLLRWLVMKFDFQLYNRNLIWFQDEEYRKVWAEFPDTNDFVHERRFNLYYFAKSVRAVPGDLAECGVFKGAGSFLMLSATEDTGKFLHGFDSFEGLSKPNQFDHVASDHTFKWKENDIAVDESIAMNNLAKYSDRFAFHKGWIPERFHEVDQARFCMVHIDVDLYEPTCEAMRFFFPRLNPGGIVVCDDYGSEACPGAKRAMDETAAEHGAEVVHLTTGQGLVMKPN